MGGHYGSVQLRCDDRTRVRAAAEAVACQLNLKCLVGPALNGWVGVYPEGNGQDHTVGEQIAAAVGGPALHLLVHDDDVLAYWLWVDGQLVDRYWSAPGDFGEANRAEEQPLVGDPERFAFVLDAAGRAKLRKLLRRNPRPTFESKRLAALGTALGIRNLVTAFEYLTGGDAGGVTGWPRRFREVPAGRAQAERARRAASKAKIKAERARLQAEGLLLVCDEQADRMLPTATAAADGLIVTWSDPWRQRRLVQFHCHPWKVPTTPADLLRTPEGHIDSLASGQAARRLATSAGHVVRIWDRSDDGWQVVADIADESWAGDLAISPDGSRIAYKRNEPRELVVADIASGQRVGAVGRLGMDRQVAFSPDGMWLAVAGVTLGVVPLVTPLVLRSVPISGHRPSGPTHLRGPLDAQAAVESQQGKVRALKDVADAGEGAATTADLQSVELRSVRLKADAILARARQQFDSLAGKARTSAEHCCCVGFDALGRWMWVGTELGLRVYDWAAVKGLAAGGRLSAVWAFNVPAVGPPPRSSISYGYVYAAVGEVEGGGVVFGGLTAQLFRMDLSDGRVTRLVDVTGGGVISGLAMSADGSTLGVCSYVREKGGLPVSSALEVWDYRRLVARA